MTTETWKTEKSYWQWMTSGWCPVWCCDCSTRSNRAISWTFDVGTLPVFVQLLNWKWVTVRGSSSLPNDGDYIQQTSQRDSHIHMQCHNSITYYPAAICWQNLESAQIRLVHNYKFIFLLTHKCYRCRKRRHERLWEAGRVLIEARSQILAVSLTLVRGLGQLFY